MRVVELPVEDEAEARPPEYSDEALALRFATVSAEALRYVASWGRWYQWSGVVWAPDDTLAAYDRVRHECRAAAADLTARDTSTTAKRQAANVASAKAVAAVERLARSDRRLAATVSQWDREREVFTTAGETIDLRTGENRPARREDYSTKCSAVAPREMATPLWDNFIDRVTGGDPDFEAYLQRVAGYCLTGHVKEHALFFLFGHGANGKSVFVNTLAGIWGDYAITAPVDLFMASHTERHPTELAMLRGARLVTATETTEGRRWDEAKIKMLTGGDAITARFMRQDFFEFEPHFKLVISGNHKPALRSVDEAIRRRIHLIPFTVTIPPKERDPDLSDKLKAEWPGILAWAVRGCQEWRRQGLNPPEAVRTATDDYLAGEDALALWTEECCEPDVTWFETTGDLFTSWKAWAERTGEHIGTRKAFGQRLEERGLDSHRRDHGRGFLGLHIQRPNYTDDPRYGG